MVGVGWSIAGPSTIVRCPRTWAQDGAVRAKKINFQDQHGLTEAELLSIVRTPELLAKTIFYISAKEVPYLGLQSVGRAR